MQLWSKHVSLGRIGDFPRHERTVIEAIKDEEKHGANISARGPIILDVVLWCLLGASVLSLQSISTSPNDHGQDKQSPPSSLGSSTPAETCDVKSIAKKDGSEDLTSPVQSVVEGSGSDVEESQVDYDGLAPGLFR